MQRRKFIQYNLIAGLGLTPIARASHHLRAFQSGMMDWKIVGPKEPVFIYNNWSSYDELSDNIPLTESLALRELDELIRLKKSGVRFDYYVMDAFWFSKEGGYRTWLNTHWPNGPDKWLQRCKENNIKPGLWFATNLVKMGGRQVLDIVPAWEDAVGTDPNILCLFDGGYLQHLADTLQIWYNKGVRLFKFDFAYFEAVTPSMKDKFTKEEIVEKNKVSFMKMLQDFRQRNQDIIITGYNGFGGDMENTYAAFDKRIDPRWLDTFDTLYSGDPRFSDVPMMNIWRSADNYSDHQVVAFKAYGLPVNRIDNCAFMIGKTGTCYSRATQCWKGMAILALARGGWVNVLHGNLELLTEEDAKWLARLQHIFLPLQRENNTEFFGGIPGEGNPYGFRSSNKNGSVITVVNPSQAVLSLDLPEKMFSGSGQILYRDGGFHPAINGNKINIGPEQLLVFGFGAFGAYDNKLSALRYWLGIDESIIIPSSIYKLEIVSRETGNNEITFRMIPPAKKNIRVLFQQFDTAGKIFRDWGESPPNGKRMNEILTIDVKQGNRNVLLQMQYDKQIWSGLSWGAVEIKEKDMLPGQEMIIVCRSMLQPKLLLKARVFAVEY
jgi:hypothetical protein